MPKQTIQVQSPIRGVDRSKGREAQPDSSVYDALNVLPYDRTGRIRAGQRAGTASLIDTTTAFPVNGLYQVTLNQTDASTANDVVIINDGFDAGWIANTDEPLPAYYTTYTGGSFGLTTATPNAVVQTGARPTGAAGGVLAVANPANSTFSAAIVTDPAFAVTPNHTIFTDIQIEAGTIYRLYTRISQSPPSVNNWVTLQVNLDAGTITLRKRVAGTITDVHVDTFSATPTSGEIMSIRLTVASDVFQVDYSFGLTNAPGSFSATITDLASNVGCGFQVDKSQVVVGNVEGVQSFMVTNNLPATESRPRDVRLIATSKGDVFAGTTSGFTAEHDAVLTHSKPSITDFNGHVYLVDGTNTLDYDVRGDSIGALTATAGSVPSGCRVARTWRGRLVLAAADADPQNYFFARVGTPTDFDFSQSDAAAAFAGNDSQAGRVSDLILDMIPFTNDQLIIAGDHSLWMMRGDPADNGSVDLISNALGIIGRDAWCIAPDGVLYFIGTGGFYRMQPGSNQPEPISSTKYDQFFTGLDRSSQYYSLQWDRDHHGCNIFVTTINAGSSSLHLWYDLRTDSFWPIQYPDNHGPVSSLVYDADGPADRVLLLGGRDGVIRQVSATNRNDAGTAITSYVILGPFKPFSGAAVLTTTQLNFGELAPADEANPERWGVTVTLQGGVDAYSVTEGTPHVIATVDCPLERRQKFLRQRIRGGWFTVKLANSASNNYWAFESAVLDFEDGGKLREIR